VLEVLGEAPAHEVDLRRHAFPPQLGNDPESVFLRRGRDRYHEGVDDMGRCLIALPLQRQERAVKAYPEARGEGLLPSEQLRQGVGPAAADLLLRAQDGGVHLENHSRVVIEAADNAQVHMHVIESVEGQYLEDLQ